ncbi:DUF572-domain-containing protein [Lactarius hatsudake]|nr:DUF572-domain-containing protein [Lactarius hatsudake]
MTTPSTKVSTPTEANTPWETEPGKLIRVFSSLVLSFLSISGGTHAHYPPDISWLTVCLRDSGTCNAHIGMGVRYNAEKKKIGIGWFEIQTDPQNTRYVVVSGARRKEEDWDPAENGGFAVHDTEGKTEPVDPLAALEKTTDAQTHATKVQAPRLEQLEDLSAHYNEDPYAHSQRARKRFRAEKKVEQARADADTRLKEKYGLPAELALERADDASTSAEARDEWAQPCGASRGRRTSEAQARPGGPCATPGAATAVSLASSEPAPPPISSAAASLRARLLSNSARRSAAGSSTGAFLPATSRKGAGGVGLAAGITLRKT